MAPTTTAQVSRRVQRRRAAAAARPIRLPRTRSASRRSHTTAPAAANRAGSRWQSRVTANSTAARARCRPVRSPAAKTPRNSRAKERLSENEYSPANVGRMLPPFRQTSEGDGQNRDCALLQPNKGADQSTVSGVVREFLRDRT